MEKEAKNELLTFFKEDDGIFFEKYLMNLSDEELTKFLDENPDFLASIDS